jgi:hypothetical protein
MTEAPAPSTSPVAAPASEVMAPQTLTPEVAHAQIQALTGDKDFWNRLKQKDASAHQEWARLHKAAYPSDASAAGQEQARTAESWNQYVAGIKQSVPGLSEQQEAEIRAGVTNKQSHEWAVREKELMIKDRAFRVRLLDGDRDAKELWTRVNAILAMRVVA